MVTWTKIGRHATWMGAAGQETFVQREKFMIMKAKPTSAPHTRWAARMRKRVGVAWTYDYTLHARDNTSTVHFVGRYPTFEAAKEAAEAYQARGEVK